MDERTPSPRAGPGVRCGEMPPRTSRSNRSGEPIWPPFSINSRPSRRGASECNRVSETPGARVPAWLNAQPPSACTARLDESPPATPTRRTRGAMVSTFASSRPQAAATSSGADPPSRTGIVCAIAPRPRSSISTQVRAAASSAAGRPTIASASIATHSLKVVGAREGRDDADTNYRLARGLLEQHPDLVGLYKIGGGADGVARAIREGRRDTRMVFVAHGLTPDTRALLIDGTLDAVINQHPHTMLLNCVRIFTNLRESRSATSGVEPVRISIMLRENLP